MRITSFFIPLAYPSPCEVPLNLLQGPALSLRYLAPEVEQRDQGEGAEQEEHPHSADRVTLVNRGPHVTETNNEKTPSAALQHKGSESSRGGTRT
jgi:hypothetical protein